MFNSSNTLSKAAESDAPGCMTGFRFSISLNNGLSISCSWTFIQLQFPLKVFISPLWATALNG